MSRRPAPLPDGRVRKTLVQRLAPRVDRLRQLNTRFGLRARRVFLVWTIFSGDERGEGDERVLERIELLPTPRITDASAINYRSGSGGTLPDGTLRVDQISVVQCTTDMLRGVRFGRSYSGVPAAQLAPVAGSPDDPVASPRVDFFYEIVEDARDDQPAMRERFRLFGQPWRNEGAISFSVLLEAISEPLGRDGNSRYGESDL